MDLSRSNIPRPAGFFESIEGADRFAFPIHEPDLSVIAPGPGFEIYAASAGLGHSARAGAVTGVFGRRCLSEIGKPIISREPVSVVELGDWPCADHIKPGQAVGVIEASADVDIDVSPIATDSPCGFASIARVPLGAHFVPMPPSKYARGWIVIKNASKDFGGEFHEMHHITRAVI